MEYIKKQGTASLKELIVYVKQIGIMPVGREFRNEDIEQIIQVMAFDLRIEVHSGSGPNAVNRPCNMKFPNKVIFT